MDNSFVNETAVIIPAYKPDDRLPPYIAALREAGIGKIVIVDDGSGEEFGLLFASIPQDEVVHIISYMPNAGKGVALKRGMEYIKDECQDQRFVITADSDGQHTVHDVLRMAGSLGESSEGLLLGSRDFAESHVPPKSRMGNRITSVVFKLLYGHWVSDTQTGLRGFERKLLPMMIAVRGDRYEYEMNMLIECSAHKLPMRPLTIETVYENNNEGSHFRAVRDSARIYGVIFGGFFRFISASLISFLVDYGLYLLINNLLKQFVPALDNEFNLIFMKVVSRIAIATVAARVLSGIVNYALNRKLVFASKASAKKTFPRYLVVFFLIMVLSAGLTSSMHVWFGWSDNMSKIPVDIALFFLSYYLQRKWVFIKEVELEEAA
ncbi:MAG: glycosyltransferase [Clostridiales bacterium]|nr:glycosyltransferase [Clostridiales bacterium]